jgi:endonuclease YncB( thermonuclease family)
VEKTDKVGIRAALSNTWAWYLARSLVMRIVIGFVAFALVLMPFSGEDVDSIQPEASAAEADAEKQAEADPEAQAKVEAEKKAQAAAEAQAEADAERTAQAEAAATAEAKAKAKAAKKAAIAARTYLVTRVIDGDTIELANGQSVRVVGIDTPERGECGYDRATSNMQRLVLGKRVRLTVSDEDTDRYGRLLRYVDVGKRDAGLAQITSGLAIARYDSRDGYGFHPRENPYIAADQAAPDKTTCPRPKPTLEQKPSGGGASVYYENCTAARDAGAAPVRRGDPGYGSHLDRDGDGVGCE